MGELLFSVTAADCRFDYFRGSGKGGQKRNKTSSGVRATHIASGAVGVSDDTRSQHKNKEIAFQRMAETKEFKLWHKLEVGRMMGDDVRAREYADRESRRAKVEVIQDGVWVDEREALQFNEPESTSQNSQKS